MSKNEIISELYTCDKFNIILSSISDSKHKDDLKQEFFLIIMKLDEKKVQEMYYDSKGYIYKWSRVVLRNQFNSKSSPYFKKYKDYNKLGFPEVTYDDSNSDWNYDWLLNDGNYDQVNLDNLQLVEEIESILDNEIHWYDAHIFKLYYLHNIDSNGDILKPLSMRKIEKLHTMKMKDDKLKIDHNRIFYTVKKTLKIIIEKLIKKGLVKPEQIKNKKK